MTEAPARSVVPVPPADADPEATASSVGSMPPTDLDVVAMLGGLPALSDDDTDEREVVIVLPDSPDDESVDDVAGAHGFGTGGARRSDRADLDAGPAPTGAVRRPAGSAGRASGPLIRETGGPSEGPPASTA